jgi:tetratricopeptide (TPR) repeat protein
MAEALSIHQPQVAKAAKKLIANGLILTSKAHVEGIEKARKIYQLTAKGKAKANAIKKALHGQSEMVYRPKDLLFSLSNSIHNLQEMESKTTEVKTQLEIVSKLQELYYELGQRLNIDESFRVLELSREIGKEIDVAKAHYYLGRAYSLQNKWDLAIENLKNGLEIAEKNKMHGTVSKINLALAGVYNRTGNLKDQEKHLQSALVAAGKTNEYELILRAFIDMGILYRYLGKYSKSKWQFEKAAELTTNNDYEGYHIMRLYNNLGMLSMSKRKYQDAIGYFLKVINYANKKNYTIGIAYGWTNTADAYARLGDVKKAKEAVNRAVPIVKYLNNENLRMGLLRISGLLAAKEGNLKRAEKLFDESIEIANKIEHKYHLSDILVDYASIYPRKTQKDKRKKLLSQALEIVKQLGNKIIIKKIEGELAKL